MVSLGGVAVLMLNGIQGDRLRWASNRYLCHASFDFLDYISAFKGSNGQGYPDYNNEDDICNADSHIVG